MDGSRATVLVAWQRMMTMAMALLYHSISPLAALLIISSSPMSCRDPLRDLLPSSSVSNRARSRGLWLLKVDRSLLGLTPENQKTVNIDSENIWKPKFLKFSDFLLFYKFWITESKTTTRIKTQRYQKLPKSRQFEQFLKK